MPKDRLHKDYFWAFAYALLPGIMALFTASLPEIKDGFLKIMTADNLLITDYFALAGVGATLANVSAVTLISVLLMYLCRVPLNGGGILVIGLMSGFSFFGKSVFNMWFILLGTYLYCLAFKKRFSECVVISLLSTSLAPLISHLFFYNDRLFWGNMFLSLVCGLLIGFVMPIAGPYAASLLKGMSLYGMGFSVGLLCLVIVPVLKSYGYQFSPVTVWRGDLNFECGTSLAALCVFFIGIGTIKGGRQAIKNYLNILKRSGVSSQDFTYLDGMCPVFINMGVNGLAALCYILAVGGHINGPTIGGILTVMGFSGKGKHLFNILPIMLGVALGGITKQWDPNSPSAQLAALFGTTLAPISGTFGPIAGIITGFIHSSVVLHAGMGYSGVNLYNNGFAGAIVSIVVYPVFIRMFRQNTYDEPSYMSKAYLELKKGENNEKA